MVLDHKDSQIIFVADLLDKVCKLLSLLRVHAGSRLIQQQQFGIRSKGTGNLQTALNAVGQRAGDLVLQVEQILLCQKSFCFLPHALFFFIAQTEGGGEDIVLGTHVLCNQNVVKYRQLRKQPNILEGTGNAEFGDLIRCRADDMGVLSCIFTEVLLLHFALGVIFQHGLSLKGDEAIGWLIDAGDAVKGGCLACTVGADQCNDLPLIDIQREVVDSDNAAELHGNVFYMKDILTHFATSSFLGVFARFLNRSGSSLVPMMPRLKNNTMIMMITENTTIRKPLRSRHRCRRRQ